MMTNKLCWQERMAHFAALATLVAINQASASAQDIQYRGDPNAEKRMTLLLKDSKPATSIFPARAFRAGKMDDLRNGAA
jgi:hypothetical protein